MSSLRAITAFIVKLKEVVRVKNGIELGAKNYDVNSYLDGQPSVTLAVFQLPGSNAIDTAKAIKTSMDNCRRRTSPKGVKYEIVYDTTVFIEESITAVYHTLIEAIVLVFIVVLVFLQNWRATIIPMIAVPVSLVGTFAIMSALGFSLNNLSLFGLVLAIGIVVDDAIVVVENVERYLAMGNSPLEASRKAMDEVSGPVIGIALVLCAVFVPTAFMAGITGQFFKQFALTIATSTIISAFNSLTLSPALCAILLKSHGHGDKKNGHGEHEHAEALPRLGIVIIGGLIAMVYLGRVLGPHFGIEVEGHGHGDPAHPTGAQTLWLFRAGMFAIGGVAGWFGSGLVNRGFVKFFQGFNWSFDRTINGYGRAVTLLIRASAIALLVYVGLLAGTVGMFKVVPGGFIPEQDKGYLVVNAQLQDGASLERTDEIVKKMTDIAMSEQFKESIGHCISVPGYSILTGTNISNVGGMFVILRPFEERKGKPALERPGRGQETARGLSRADHLGERGGLRRAADRRPGKHRRLQAASAGPRLFGATRTGGRRGDSGQRRK